jgi:hypothetical protein
MLPKHRIHFIEKMDHVWQVPNSAEWESGYWWNFGKENAEKLIEERGHIYLHKAQSEPSHHGGVITGYRIQHEGKFKGRFIFRFRPTNEDRGVMAEPDRWFRYKQLVL